MIQWHGGPRVTQSIKSVNSKVGASVLAGHTASYTHPHARQPCPREPRPPPCPHIRRHLYRAVPHKSQASRQNCHARVLQPHITYLDGATQVTCARLRVRCGGCQLSPATQYSCRSCVLHAFLMCLVVCLCAGR